MSIGYGNFCESYMRNGQTICGYYCDTTKKSFNYNFLKDFFVKLYDTPNGITGCLGYDF